MCPNSVSPSMCCSSVSGTCASSKYQQPTHSTVITLHDTPHTHKGCGAASNSNIAYLQTLSSHLDLLTAGSLFILPSILPYLASALTATCVSSASYTSSKSSHNSTSTAHISLASPEELVSEPWTWSMTWIMLLPCMGVIIPLSLFKLLAVTEEKYGIQCPYKQWRQSRAMMAQSSSDNIRRKRMSQRNCGHKPTNGHTHKMIKRIWYKLMGITTFGAVDNARDEENQGYVPLMSAYQGEANAEEGRRDNSEKKGMHDQADFGPKRSVLSSSSSALPRPKTILVVSLWVWTLLMFLSSQMGLNSLAPLPTPSAVSPSSSSLSSMGTNIQLDANEALWPEDPSLITTADTKDVRPFARIQTNIIIINGDSNGSYNDNVTPLEHSIADIMEVAEIEADIEDMDSSSGLDALIMDSRDEVVFHDFLHQLDQEEKAFRAASAEYDSELQDTQKMEQQRRELYQATDDLMIDNDLPCEYYSSSSSWFANIQQYLVGDSITDGVHYPGRTFVYKGWLTNLMIVAASMCLGGVLVGLAQSKALCHQLMVEQQQHLATICPMTIPQQSGTPWKTLLVGFFVAASALGLTLLMIIDESWDVPAIYFVGIGIAGLILVHHWVPSTALTVYSGHLVEDTIEDEDCYNDDDDTCIGSDTESDDAKLVSPLAWSPPMAERRNACSLDENRRWEVVTTATIHETIGYR